jgi:hypothetical protein
MVTSLVLLRQDFFCSRTDFFPNSFNGNFNLFPIFFPIFFNLFPIYFQSFFNLFPIFFNLFQSFSIFFQSFSIFFQSFSNLFQSFFYQVLTSARTPTHWVPMDVSATECKLMEVRKYSAEYQEIDSKFRKPHLVTSNNVLLNLIKIKVWGFWDIKITNYNL